MRRDKKKTVQKDRTTNALLLGEKEDAVHGGIDAASKCFSER